MTKSEVTEQLKKICGIRRWKLFTFNSHRRMSNGTIGFPDHQIVADNKIITIEVKLGTDRMSEKQKRVKEYFTQNAEKSTNLYYELTDKNAEDIYSELIDD